MKPPQPQVCTHYDIRSPVFHLPDIRHSFAEQSIRYCLINFLKEDFIRKSTKHNTLNVLMLKRVVWILFIIHHFTILK